MRLEFSWAHAGAGRGVIKKPSWASISSQIDLLPNLNGQMTLTDFEPDWQPTLEVQYEHGMYVLLLSPDPNKENGDVRIYYNKNPPPFNFWMKDGTGQMVLGGDFWNPHEVFTDLEIVRESFRQFFETGDVSSDLLD